MSQTLEAIIHGNTIQPLEKLLLPENERVLVTIVSLDHSPRDKTESCYDVMQRLGLLGMVKDAPADLSSNPEHLIGFGSV